MSKRDKQEFLDALLIELDYACPDASAQLTDLQSEGLLKIKLVPSLIGTGTKGAFSPGAKGSGTIKLNARFALMGAVGLEAAASTLAHELRHAYQSGFFLAYAVIADPLIYAMNRRVREADACAYQMRASRFESIIVGESLSGVPSTASTEEREKAFDENWPALWMDKRVQMAREMRCHFLEALSANHMQKYYDLAAARQIRFFWLTPLLSRGYGALVKIESDKRVLCPNDLARVLTEVCTDMSPAIPAPRPYYVPVSDESFVDLVMRDAAPELKKMVSLAQEFQKAAESKDKTGMRRLYCQAWSIKLK